MNMIEFYSRLFCISRQKIQQQPLIDDQKKYIDEMSSKCYKLLEETHPNGLRFANTIKVKGFDRYLYYLQRILHREELWVEWKNAGCKDYATTGAISDKDRIPPPIKR